MQDLLVNALHSCYRAAVSTAKPQLGGNHEFVSHVAVGRMDSPAGGSSL